jgi:hypothetical protein
MIFYLLGG